MSFDSSRFASIIDTYAHLRHAHTHTFVILQIPIYLYIGILCTRRPCISYTYGMNNGAMFVDCVGCTGNRKFSRDMKCIGESLVFLAYRHGEGEQIEIWRLNFFIKTVSNPPEKLDESWGCKVTEAENQFSSDMSAYII